MTALAIIGSRTITDYSILQQAMIDWFDFSYVGSHPVGRRVTEIISGGARGADALAARWARDHNVKLTEYIPDWDRYGKRAGFIRNEDIIKAADVVLGLWDGISRGTANSLGIAKRLKKPTIIIYV